MSGTPAIHAKTAARWKAEGLCPFCGRPRTNGTRCAHHQALLFEHGRKVRTTGRLNRCSVCKETGHNKSTHPASAAPDGGKE